MLGEYFKKGDIIPLSYDLMFKKVFGDENDTEPVKYLLKVILGIEAKEIIILKDEKLDLENYRQHRATVRLIAILEDGTKVGVDLNLNP